MAAPYGNPEMLAPGDSKSLLPTCNDIFVEGSEGSPGDVAPHVGHEPVRVREVVQRE